MNVDVAVAQLRALLLTPGSPLGEVGRGAHGPEPSRERRGDGHAVTFFEGFGGDVGVGLVSAFGLGQGSFHVTADVHRESLVTIASIEKTDVGGNKSVELREDLEGVVTVDRSRLVPKHSLDEVVEAALRVRTMDVEEALDSIAVQGDKCVVGRAKRRYVSPAQVCNGLNHEPCNGVLGVDADEVVQH